MNGMWRLQSMDGANFEAFVARPTGTPRGIVLVVQEVFGVNDHIRAVTTQYAHAGYIAVAPSLFDRLSPGVQLGYDPPGIAEGVRLMKASAPETVLADIEITRAAFGEVQRAAVLGYCWGGTMAWLSAARLPKFAAAVAYYPGGIGNVVQEEPRCPVLLHFGERDDHIPVAEVAAVRDQHAHNVTVYTYPAGHGFNCDERGSYDAASAHLAQERTLEFLATHLS